MINIAMYLRLSVEEAQKEESTSIRNQRDLIESYIKDNFQKQDYKIYEYIDDGYSGTNTSRPSFERLMNDVKDLKINCIVVKDMSRFSRDYIEMGNYLENIFPFLGIRFISINDSFDSSLVRAGITEIDTQFKNLLYDFYSKDLSKKVKTSVNMLKQNRKVLT